jgi:ribosome biogenesis protein UTP30
MKCVHSSIPHALNTSRTSTICLITADPQRPFKDAIANPSFPADLRSRITRVISLSKLRLKYKSYESKRQLSNEHDIFLADDRVVALLPNILGNAFYKSGIKRPITVKIAAEDERKSKEKEGNKMKSRRIAAVSDHSVASPKRLADEITKTLSTALVHLSPSTCTSVRVGKTSWDATKVAENIEAVVAGLIAKFVPKGWRGVRAIHVKGPETAALPLWLADELWLDEGDILDDASPRDEAKAIEGNKRETDISRKRKAFGPKEEAKARKKLKGVGRGREGNPSIGLGKEAALQREKLGKQKAEATEEAEVAVVTKEAVKAKVVDHGRVRVKTKKSKQ